MQSSPILNIIDLKEKTERVYYSNDSFDESKYEINLDLPLNIRCIALNSTEILVTGGLKEKETLKKVDLINIQDKVVTAKQPMHKERHSHAITFLGSLVFVIGGYSGPDKNSITACEVFDTGSDSWTQKASLQ